jgi:hypothetical protein
MNIDFGSMIVVGAIVSLFIQGIKSNISSKNLRMVAVLLASILAGAAYHFLRDTAILQTIVTVLMAAGSVYVFLLKQLEN